jgi:hypothetical protein
MSREYTQKDAGASLRVETDIWKILFSREQMAGGHYRKWFLLCIYHSIHPFSLREM